MPELPEVEIIRRGLETAAIDKCIGGVRVNRRDLRTPIPQNLKTTIEKQTIIATVRRGKYILIFLESGAGMVLHLGMSGRIKIYGPDQSYQSEKHDHVVFEMTEETQIIFNDPRRFGMLYLTTQEDWQNEKPFCNMGPEPLGNDFNGPVLEAALKNRCTPIKTALLDQRIVAGIGNIYACEALYMAGIDPVRHAYTVQGQEAERLAQALREVLKQAIEAGGSTLKDYRHTDDSLGYFQHSFSVYDREGQACPSCDCGDLQDGLIKRMVQSGRSTFYCPQKQR